MNQQQPSDKPADPADVNLTMRALGEDGEAAQDARDARAGETLAQTKMLAGALKDAYQNAPLPRRSQALKDAIDEALADKPQPAAQRRSERHSRVLVLTVCTCIVALVITLHWHWEALNSMLADVGAPEQEHPSPNYMLDDVQYGNGDSPDTPLGLKFGLETNRKETIVDDSASMSSLTREMLNAPIIDAFNSSLTVENPWTEDRDSDVVIDLDSSGPPTADFDLRFTESLAMHDRRISDLQRLKQKLQQERASRPYALAELDEAIQLETEARLAAEGRREGGRPEAPGGQRYARIYENAFQTVGDHPLSTFSIDVDTASYSKMRQYLNAGRLPPPDSVRIEELVNYFPYDYLGPMGAHPFTAHMEICECPWRPEHRLARIAVKGREIKPNKRPLSNLVFLLDVSGSMNQANKLPLVIQGMRMLIEQLGENDRVAIVVYAGAAGEVLPSTPGDQKATILAALDKLRAGGSTAGAAGLELAYKTARENFIEGGVNRVLLCTDGDFNVGTADDAGLVRLAEEQAKSGVFLSILGFGMDNLNDSMLEQVSGKANGMYAFIDTEKEARKVLIEQLSGTLVTIAKDVKIQVEFNPAKVKGYRLIGYENRILAAEDFNDDKKDAGEIGAGHTVTALYEIVPADADVEVDAADVDELKYQQPAKLTAAADSDELLTLKLRYKQPDGDKSTLISFPVDDDAQRFSEASGDFQFAAAVASFGMLLRGSRYAGNATLDGVLEIANGSLGDDPWGYRQEFVELVAKAKEIAK